MGPLLFILYINNFAKVSDKLFHVLFVDDTNVFLNGKNINMLIDTIQKELLNYMSGYLQTNYS